MVQEYLEDARINGDIRVLILNGDIIGAMRRMPSAGDFRANVHAGATVIKHEITERERNVCSIIRSRLVRDGLYFVGIDMIGDKLVEINCVSPGGIPRINHLNDERLEKKVIDFVEQKAREHKTHAVS
jgi:glutathione synthase